MKLNEYDSLRWDQILFYLFLLTVILICFDFGVCIVQDH